MLIMNFYKTALDHLCLLSSCIKPDEDCPVGSLHIEIDDIAAYIQTYIETHDKSFIVYALNELGKLITRLSVSRNHSCLTNGLAAVYKEMYYKSTTL